MIKKDLIKKEELVLVQVFYLFIVPVLLLYFKIIPGQLRLLFLFIIAMLLLGIIYKAKWTFADIGIKKHWGKEWMQYSIFTLCGILFLFWLSTVVPHEPFLEWWENRRFLLLFIPISVMQEVLFRGILMKMLLEAVKSVEVAIFINATVFCVLHIMYVHATFVLPLTFIGGVAFAWMYTKYKNLVLISISHTIFNFVAMILGFFVLR
jgi:membrane protease YdiL (CAAX protease family)